MKEHSFLMIILSLISCQSKNEPKKEPVQFQLHYSQDAQLEIEQMPSKLKEMCQIHYGSLPEWLSSRLGKSTADLIGVGFSYFEGENVKKVARNAYQSMERSFIDAKSANDRDLQQSVQELIINIGIHSAYKKNLSAGENGIDSEKHSKNLEFIDDLQIKYDKLSTGAKNENDNHDLLKQFDKEFWEFDRN